MAFELAIVGLDCRFPGSKNVAEYWENLQKGVDCVSVLNAEDIANSGLDESYVSSPHFVGAAYEVVDIDKFDAAFFGIAEVQAMVMSPQHRLILESAWNACEYAGYSPQGFSEDVGVFIGSDDNTYYLGLRNNPTVAELGAQKLITLGNYLAYLPAWVSYKLNLKGPSLGVHAGCSSSLAAVHLACNSLLLGECKVAIAGAVAAKVPQRGYYHYEPGGIESQDGRCRPFDEDGTGTVYGNGVGTLVIKRLADALADRDTIHAIIKGSALNNDGGAKVSFSTPNAESWTSVITEALANSEVPAESIGYIEAHGTGTPVGDAIEIEALTKAFRKQTNKKNYCAVGSVKSNIGHLEAAAGMAGLIKTICILKHGLIPPTVHFTSPNPRIDFGNNPFFVNRTLIRWPDNETPRRAAVNAFGIGGGNAQVVLEAPPPVMQQPAPSSADQLLLLSAKTPSALGAAIGNLLQYLQRNPSLRTEDIAYTLLVGREVFSYRRAVVCRSVAEAIDKLKQIVRRTTQVAHGSAEAKQPALVIAGISSAKAALLQDPYTIPPQLLDELLQLPEFKEVDRESSSRAILSILAHLWEGGVEIRKELLGQSSTGRRIPLPTYPFERKRYWIDERHEGQHTIRTESNRSEPAAGAQEPASAEYRLLDICKKLLDMPSMSPTENFFDLGANSLHVNQLRTRIREDLGVDISLQALFANPSVRGVSTHLASMKEAANSE